ncbi:MAG: hypothetical protein ABS79_06165 [Planctomycetes bacterium SCN 63-9]|nr:MAG: hypothetical protein ABS79_06165 [Planctomycetes bacterium SCN 63-9]
MCENCGHRVRAEDAQAGRRARCAHCGHKMMIPGTRVAHHHDEGDDDEKEFEFRLAPIDDDDPEPPARVMASNLEPEIASAPAEPPARRGHGPRLKPDEGEDEPRFGAAGIPEELLADRAPIPIDTDFAPASSSASHDESRLLMNTRAKMYHGVRSILGKIQWMENWLYILSLLFLMTSIAGLLIDYPPLAHSGAVGVVLASVLLAAFGGIQVLIKPFQQGIFGTSWKSMKKQIRHALAAFIPLLVLIASYYFIKPIRDYFLETAPAREAKQQSSRTLPVVDPMSPPPFERPAAVESLA